MTGAPFPQIAITRRHLRLVPPSRPRSLDVQITAAAGRSPVGLTRDIRLTDHDFERLIDHALRLEQRR